VLITGAARGIGAEVARQAAGRGARVSCVGLEPEELERVAHACGSDAMWFEADVTDLDSLERAVAGTVERSGGIDVVVANAGVASTGSVRHLPVDAFERVIDVNVLGVYRTVRTCLPHVLDRRGYVLCMASLAAIVPSFPGFSAYATSKAAVEAFGMSLRPEVEHLGVDVGVAFLSWFATDLVRGADAEHPAFKLQRERLSWPVNKTHPLPDAGKAIIRGIERRSPVVAAPRWVGLARYLRGVLLPITQRQIASDAPEVMALMEAEYQRAGADAARPVGAGGAADARASGARLS
jgi:NAD(P)-dependent dehydrogenase (short-subunit alcohol dehydrogenase family)